MDRRDAVGGRRAIGGEQGELARLARAFIEDGDGAFPGETLAVVDLAKVKHMALRHLAPRVALALHDRPAAMRLPVLVPRPTFEEHAGSLADRGRVG